jgi:hypothetical protein
MDPRIWGDFIRVTTDHPDEFFGRLSAILAAGPTAEVLVSTSEFFNNLGSKKYVEMRAHLQWVQSVIEQRDREYTWASTLQQRMASFGPPPPPPLSVPVPMLPPAPELQAPELTAPESAAAAAENARKRKQPEDTDEVSQDAKRARTAGPPDPNQPSQVVTAGVLSRPAPAPAMFQTKGAKTQ